MALDSTLADNVAAGLMGQHYLAEFKGCPADLIATVDAVEGPFIDVLTRHGASVLGHTSHQFEPAGATVVVLLAESHASLHTWPEINALCIDFFTCSDALKADAALDELTQIFAAQKVHRRVVDRVVPQGNE